jgi:hypothetical protein
MHPPPGCHDYTAQHMFMLASVLCAVRGLEFSARFETSGGRTRVAMDGRRSRVLCGTISSARTFVSHRTRFSVRRRVPYVCKYSFAYGSHDSMHSMLRPSVFCLHSPRNSRCFVSQSARRRRRKPGHVLEMEIYAWNRRVLRIMFTEIIVVFVTIVTLPTFRKRPMRSRRRRIGNATAGAQRCRDFRFDRVDVVY